jgi:hypothetical protein
MTASTATPDVDFRASREGDRFTLSLCDASGAGALAEVDIETARLWFDRFEAALGSGRLRTRGASLDRRMSNLPKERTA